MLTTFDIARIKSLGFESSGGGGTGGTSIDDTVTNRQETWSSGKIFDEMCQSDIKGYQEDYVKMLSSQMSIVKSYLKCINKDYPSFDIIYEFEGGSGIKHGFKPNTFSNGPDNFSTLQYVSVGECGYNNITKSTSNYDTKDGTFTETHKPNCFAGSIGDTMEVTFTGAEAIGFNFYADNRGGVWKFTLDNDASSAVYVSTFASPTVIENTSVLFDNLDKNTEYTVTGEFMGEDSEHEPVGSDARGWYKFNDNATGVTNNTFALINKEIVIMELVEVLKDTSNKDFAFHMKRKDATCDAQFFPLHSNVYTVQKESEMKIYVDNILTEFDENGTIEFKQKVEFIQSIYCKLPDDDEYNIAHMFIKWVFTKNGVAEYFAKFKALEDIEIDNGYINMLPVKPDICKTLVTSFNNTYQTVVEDGSRTYLDSEKDNMLSVLWGNGDYDNICVALTFTDMMNTYRKDQTGIGKYYKTWVHHRTDDMQKLYPQVFADAEMVQGETYKFGGRFLVCTAPYLTQLYF